MTVVRIKLVNLYKILRRVPSTEQMLGVCHYHLSSSVFLLRNMFLNVEEKGIYFAHSNIFSWR